MQELFGNLGLGVQVVFQLVDWKLNFFGTQLIVPNVPINLIFCLIGALVGTLIGVLPGIGTVATVAMLLPITFGLPPIGALIMLAGIYYGAQYGGSTTSILVNIPGEAGSVATCLDGHEMAKQGRAGAALSIAAIGSFFAGCVATVLVAALGAPLTQVALMFGPAEYFALMTLGLIFAVVLARGSVLKAVAMIVLGLLLAMVGTDIETGVDRMTFGFVELSDGIGFTNVAMGVFGFAEIIRNLEMSAESRELVRTKITGLMPTRQDLIDSSGAIARGTILGSLLGILPGGGAVVASFAAYTFEKRISKNPERFGRGAIEGVAAPESANNAAAQTTFIPLLTLGIPPNAVMALMVGAMTIQGIIPGPQVMIKQPDLFWGMIASMWFGNLMLIVINLPLVGLWVRLLRVPYRLLFPSIVVFCCIGIYSINNAPTDVIISAAFGLFGYWLSKHDFEPAPLVLAFVLGPLMEENLRRAMLLARGDASVFVTRPISAVLLAIAVGLLALAVLPSIRKRREEVFVEE
ncbi:MAG: tripartite tricarboxylate transporter permease [Xanthobacteraceae bacterium]|uniref:tripartite tricarboxylate transporter permease n=1 Tax=Pseudolabrys sp. TaxID=1960880 RepID=UPI003D0EEDB1